MNIENGKLVDRHQFDGRDSQRLQIGNLLDHAEVGPGMFHAATGILRETANVHLVDDRFREITADVAVAFPVEQVVHDDTFGRADDAIGRRKKGSRERLGVRINQARRPSKR